jgi:tRNA (cmo5U34)-methyltransferase
VRRRTRAEYTHTCRVGQFHWDPSTYRELMRAEVPDYERLQTEAVAASQGVSATEILELGTGTGETARRLLDAHPDARLLGIDSSDAMLAVARETLAGRRVQLEVARIEDPLPTGQFDLIVSALAVHHLSAADKAALFARIADALAPGGRFVLADVVIPESPADVQTPIDPDYDKPDRVSDQLSWLTDAGLQARVSWAHRDLAVLVADRS